MAKLEVPVPVTIDNFVDAKPAIQSETVRGGIYEIANGVTSIFGNVLGISQAIALFNGIASIFAGIQTIRGRKKANRRIEGFLSTPDEGNFEESGV